MVKLASPADVNRYKAYYRYVHIYAFMRERMTCKKFFKVLQIKLSSGVK